MHRIIVTSHPPAATMALDGLSTIAERSPCWLAMITPVVLAAPLLRVSIRNGGGADVH